ncbi:MAG: flagellar filament capping protein FliD [Capsulimonadaceae bacterium]|nr:flagellar filament capping protein FliD [Capsulimonadaceae bacterium]
MATSGVSGSANNTTNSTNSGRVVISGMASGLDTAGVISALTSAENNQIKNAAVREGSLKEKLGAWQQFNSLLTTLQATTSDLRTEATFKGTTATSSNVLAATVTSSAGAAIGEHALNVKALAQNNQVLSDAQAGASNPLGLVGSFLVNGKSVSVSAGDSLDNIASSINSAGAGVTAKVLSISAGNVQLSISANQSGAVNAISATDIGEGAVLQKLGIVASDAATAPRQPAKSEAGATSNSIALSSASARLSTLIGGSVGAPLAGTVQINGAKIDIDMAKMSLNDVASAINGSTAGVTAKVVSIPDATGAVTPQSKKQLQIASNAGPISVTDNKSVLASLGLVQAQYKNQATAAQDASFTLDNIAYSRSSNTVSDVIPNVAITLASIGTDKEPGTTNITVAGKTDAAVAHIQALVASYQKVNDFVNAQNKFTPSKGPKGTQDASPPLFGDYSLISVQQQLQRVFSNSVNGKTLTSIGITNDATGQITVDTAKLSAAIEADPQSVYALFGVSGKPSDPNVAFVSATTATRDATGAGYAVNITQAASSAQIAATEAQGGPSTTAETLTFGGKVFSGTHAVLTIPTGSTQQDIIDLINGDSTVSQFVYASKDAETGKLHLTAKGFGSSNSFAVYSDQKASTSNSGLGTTELSAAGQDVRGTINGEAATGIGQSLSGNSNNKTTAGLVLNVSATAPGAYGAVTVTHGLADTLSKLIEQTTQGKMSQVGSAEDAINSQISDIDHHVDQMQTQMQKYTDQLTNQFNDMESRVNTLHAQGKALNAELAANGGSSGGGGGGNKSNNL